MYDKTHNLPEQPPDNRLTLGETFVIALIFLALCGLIVLLLSEWMRG